MSFNKWLRVIIPEIQLIDYAKQNGVVRKNTKHPLSTSTIRPLGQKQQVATSPSCSANTGTQANAMSNSSCSSKSALSASPLSTGSIKEAVHDIKKECPSNENQN
ncbi:hypothetical protein LC087_04280 [Bacillus carboniphilus]|uniref:Uncharacterized protein n=1 Tax=Bacillus carboniphilus TaxID=86663 RepID=A0ABY9JX94_9BACI|nr:hypothetical protein [Bacillus carboniphilus]WLR43403.1 hypothetical protein LC087_04280 [Bacillus carboniphilus]